MYTLKKDLSNCSSILLDMKKNTKQTNYNFKFLISLFLIVSSAAFVLFQSQLNLSIHYAAAIPKEEMYDSPIPSNPLSNARNGDGSFGGGPIGPLDKETCAVMPSLPGCEYYPEIEGMPGLDKSQSQVPPTEEEDNLDKQQRLCEIKPYLPVCNQ
jgi:hypothetical protein